jgi:hypothetical protein
MQLWLREFRPVQRRELEMTGRYADEVTVSGRVELLPDAYETTYHVDLLGRDYRVRVRHPRARWDCRLAEAGGPEPGEIACHRF